MTNILLKEKQLKITVKEEAQRINKETHEQNNHSEKHQKCKINRASARSVDALVQILVTLLTQCKANKYTSISHSCSMPSQLVTLSHLVGISKQLRN